MSLRPKPQKARRKVEKLSSREEKRINMESASYRLVLMLEGISQIKKYKGKRSSNFSTYLRDVENSIIAFKKEVDNPNRTQASLQKAYYMYYYFTSVDKRRWRLGDGATYAAFRRSQNKIYGMLSKTDRGMTGANYYMSVHYNLKHDSNYDKAMMGYRRDDGYVYGKRPVYNQFHNYVYDGRGWIAPVSKRSKVKFWTGEPKQELSLGTRRGKMFRPHSFYNTRKEAAEAFSYIKEKTDKQLKFVPYEKPKGEYTRGGGLHGVYIFIECDKR